MGLIFQSELKRALEWVVQGEVGISSKTIWAVMLGVADPHAENSWRIYDRPWDVGDFRRCYLLLELIPEWKPRLNKVAELFPQWKPYVEKWDELTALYEEEKGKGSCPKLWAVMSEMLAS